MQSGFCRQCGSRLDPAATFCGACGAPSGRTGAAGKPVSNSGQSVSNSGQSASDSGSAVYQPATHSHILEALPHKTGSVRLWLALAVGAVAVMCVAGGIAYAMRPQPYQCGSPRECAGVRPPHAASPALPPSAAYHSSTYGFSLEYPDDFPPTNTSSSAITFSGEYHSGPAQWSYFGERANGRGAQQEVNDLQSGKYPGARFIYPIPDANLGYTPGYGAVYDVYVNTGGGQSAHQRLVVMAAIKHDLAVVFYGTGPYIQTTLAHDAHPNPAQTPLVHEGVFLQGTGTVRWQGDPAL